MKTFSLVARLVWYFVGMAATMCFGLALASILWSGRGIHSGALLLLTWLVFLAIGCAVIYLIDFVRYAKEMRTRWQLFKPFKVVPQRRGESASDPPDAQGAADGK